MSAAPHIAPFEDRLFDLGRSVAGQADRALFQELNPGRDYSPILSSPPKTPRPASVLIPILNRAEGYTVLFTVRSPAMPSHAGEISFPGGGPKGNDLGPVETALREAHEEVGIAPCDVDVASTFGAHFGGLGYKVTPVVGLVRKPPQIRPCDREVTEAFEVPLDFLLDLENHTIIDRNFKGIPFKMYAVPYETEGTHRFIWGLTAGVLHTMALAWHGLPAPK